MAGGGGEGKGTLDRPLFLQSTAESLGLGLSRGGLEECWLVGLSTTEPFILEDTEEERRTGGGGLVCPGGCLISALPAQLTTSTPAVCYNIQSIV